MKQCFCTICGTNKNLQYHHIKPRSRGGDDHQHNILTLCVEHHALIHQVRPSEWNNVKTLQKEGIAKAMKQGKYKGGKSRIDPKQIEELAMQGYGATAIGRKLGIHRDSVYRLVPNFKKIRGV
tara:strand:- start:166 stop:534 length:369 start_codon:yes stop_codon:yes gene_type:complete